MINVTDRVSTEVLANGAVRYEEFDAQGNSLGYKYIKKADVPSVVGTAVNKTTLDHIQNAIGKTTTFNADGSITETTANATITTTFNANGSITEVSTSATFGNITKTTTFNADGSITETIS